MGANPAISIELASTGYSDFASSLPSASSLCERISKWGSDGSSQLTRISLLSSAAGDSHCHVDHSKAVWVDFAPATEVFTIAGRASSIFL